MDQGSTRKRSAVHNSAPTVTKFCVMWEGQALPHDTKFGNSRCEIVGRRVIFIWSLIHGSSWSGLIKVGPGQLILTRWDRHISMVSARKTSTPLLKHWSYVFFALTHQYVCVNKLGHHWFRLWLVTCSLASHYRADSRFAPSQWGTALLCNDVSHWLAESLESALHYLNKWCFC